MHRVTVVDDDQDIRELLTTYLKKNSFEVSAYASAEAVLIPEIQKN